MTDDPCNVLFLCTGNSARSILGEAILNRAGAGRFRAFSAGSQPKGQVHPLARDLLLGRSKSWDEFASSGAPQFDIILTVCDVAAAETCPIWPGHPTTAHWGIPDPAAAEGSEAEKRRAFAEAYRQLNTRISVLLALPLASLDRLSLKARLTAIDTL